MPASYSTGEYLQTRLAPQILKELKDDKSGFLSAIPDAPAAAVEDEGLRLMHLNETVEAEINPAADWVDGDLNSLDLEKALIPWDSISTKPTKVTKDEMRASVFDRNSEVRMQHTKVMKRKWRDYILHNLAPDDDTNANFPVVVTTGDIIVGQRRRLRVEDLIEYQDRVRALNLEDELGWNLVLCRQHLTDLLLNTKDNQDFRDAYHDRRTGQMINVYGFNFFWGNSNPHYATDLTKNALGSALGGTDENASIFIYSENVVKSMGKLMTHFKPMEEDTRSNPAKSEYRQTAYMLAICKHKAGTGAIVSDQPV